MAKDVLLVLRYNESPSCPKTRQTEPIRHPLVASWLSESLPRFLADGVALRVYGFIPIPKPEILD